VQNCCPVFSSHCSETFPPSIRQINDRILADLAPCGRDAPEFALVRCLNNEPSCDRVATFDQFLLDGMNIGKAAKESRHGRGIVLSTW
jgi:hypothetical protein